MAKFAQLASVIALAVGATAATAPEGEAVLMSEIGRQNNQSLFWGPYKPNLYFGVRPRLAQGLWTGLMWGRVDNYQDIQNSMYRTKPTIRGTSM